MTKEFLESDQVIDLDDFEPGTELETAPGVEISADLAHFVPFRDEPDETLTPEQLAEKNKELAFEKRLKKEAPRGKELSSKALAGAEKLIMHFTGARSTGLTDADRKEFAEKMAPLLVELGVTDYATMVGKYGRYLAAAYAAYAIGSKMVQGVAADLEKQAQEQQAGLSEQPKAQPVQGYTQDYQGAGRLIVPGEVVPDGN